MFGNIQSVHIHGIVVLLASKLVNLLPKRVEVDREMEDHAGITDSQRSLAVITERIQAAHMVHLSLVDLCDVEEEGEVKDMDFGNKISILSGDLLLSKACLGLAELDCPKVCVCVCVCVCVVHVHCLCVVYAVCTCVRTMCILAYFCWF